MTFPTKSYQTGEVGRIYPGINISLTLDTKNLYIIFILDFEAKVSVGQNFKTVSNFVQIGRAHV